MNRKLDILAVLISTFTVWFIIGINAAYLPLYAFYILGASNLLVGLLSTVYFCVNAPSSIIAGYLVDKYRVTKAIFSVSLLLLSVSVILVVYIPEAEQLLWARIIQGIAVASIVPLSNLLGSELFGTGKGVGLVNMIGSLGFFLSTLLGGIILSYISYKELFLYSTIIPLVSLALVLCAPFREFGNSAYSGIKISDIKKISRPIWIMYIALFLRQLGAAGVWSMFSLFIYSLGGNNVILGVLFAINPLIQALIFERFGRYAEGRGITVFRYGLILSAVVFIGYYISTDPITIIIFQVILGVSWVSLCVGINVYIIENTPVEICGTSLGFVNTVLAFSWILGSLLSGFIADLTGSYKIYILVSALLSVIAYIAIKMLQKQ